MQYVLDGCAVINGWSACDWKYSTSPKWVDIVYDNCGSTSTEDFVPNPCEVGVIIQAGFYPDSRIEKLTPGCEIKYKFSSHDKGYYLEYVESERTVCLVGNMKENVRPGDADIWGDDFYYSKRFESSRVWILHWLTVLNKLPVVLKKGVAILIPNSFKAIQRSRIPTTFIITWGGPHGATRHLDHSQTPVATRMN